MATCLAALLCRAVRHGLNGYPGRSFLGVFSGITSPRFPQRLKGTVFAVEVADLQPADEYQVEVVRGDEVVFATEPKRPDAVGSASPAWITVPLDGAVLPAEGSYSVRLRVGNTVIASRSLLAVQVMKDPP